MRITSGKVVGGRVEVDGELPEGASVTVLAREGDETFEADAETERMLLEAIAQRLLIGARSSQVVWDRCAFDRFLLARPSLPQDLTLVRLAGRW